MKTKNQGLSGVYSNSTRAVSELFGAVGALSSAARGLSESAERSAWVSSAISAKEVAEDLGISTGDALEDLDQINNLVAKLRGY